MYDVPSFMITPPYMYDVVRTVYTWTLTLGVSLLKLGLKSNIWLADFGSTFVKKEKNKSVKKKLNSSTFIQAWISSLHIQIEPLIKEEAQMCTKLFLREFKA